MTQMAPNSYPYHSSQNTFVSKWLPGVQLAPCNLIRTAGMVPVLLVLLLQSLGYITAVPATLWPLRSTFPALVHFLLISFHLLYLSNLINYFLLVFINPGSVPDDWHAPPPQSILQQTNSSQRQTNSLLSNQGCPSSTDLLTFPNAHLMKERTYHGQLRYCRFCKAYKPDRAHHCSVCRRCILRMDHHCVFINNCVSFYNHKFFISFILFAFLSCTFVAVISFPTFAQIISVTPSSAIAEGISSNNSNHYLNWSVRWNPMTFTAAPKLSKFMKTVVLIGYTSTASFAIALTVFVGLHFYLVSKGRTTIEMYELTDPVRAPQVAEYDLGCKKNFKKVFGNVPFFWIFPTRAYIDGDGLQYETRNSSPFTGSIV